MKIGGRTLENEGCDISNNVHCYLDALFPIEIYLDSKLCPCLL
jgi:hypothetical protein